MSAAAVAELLRGGLGWVLAGATLVAATAAALHALLYKRDSRSALGWIAVSVTFPLLGPLAYYVFGINRIRTRAKRLHADSPDAVRHRAGSGAPPGLTAEAGAAATSEESGGPQTPLRDLVRLSRLVTQRPLTAGNRLQPIFGGDDAYAAMLDAIGQARRTVRLATYLFQADESGGRFVEALGEAHDRGVEVRVLVDGLGELYGRPWIGRRLRARGIPFARFLPPRLIPPQLAINLRNHRKILVVDGDVAFTGGMNIGDRHAAGGSGDAEVVDVHYRASGPLVGEIDRVFRDDWEFVTEERLDAVPAAAAEGGEAHARVIVDGPNEDIDRLQTVLVGAVSAARRRVVFMTPYFLPPRELMSAMKALVLRGRRVQVILPERTNLVYVDWASRNIQWELLQWGVEIYYRPAPFAHTKLLLVDDDYVQMGSANLDPRSLRLNFELSVEIYDRALAERLDDHVQEVLSTARPARLDDFEARPLWMRCRDAIAWLFSPYL